MSSCPFDETEDEEEGMEVEVSNHVKKYDEVSVDGRDENGNINPFANRHGKTLSWRGVNMSVVSSN